MAALAKLVDEAGEKIKKIENKLKENDEYVKQQLESAQKTRKEEIEAAVTKAERSNLSKIDDLNVQIKALNKENDLMLDYQRMLNQEKDLLTEAYDKKINMLKRSIELLEQAKSGSILDRVNNWMYHMARRLRMHRI